MRTSGFFEPRKAASASDSTASGGGGVGQGLKFFSCCSLQRFNHWLVVWDMLYFSIYWEYHPNLTNIFQRGRNHQSDHVVIKSCTSMYQPAVIYSRGLYFGGCKTVAAIGVFWKQGSWDFEKLLFFGQWE